MSNVTYIPISTDAAWRHFQTLAKQALEDPRLLRNRSHVEATLRAHQAFYRACMCEEGWRA